ncbi:hypothetical protein BP6252_04522 [Coleophoma cylindrospora]|uniref:Transferase family protein n=1 Tax=Coleophoma cylindrospora TaxID=1849047 RepID=A0A3D8S1B3_9HELO|nr:hypothetical protein BP6252_04522 [Coleophoma cylindrospora]
MDTNGSCFDVQVTSTAIVCPTKSPSSEPITVPLSIVDCTVSYYGRCACVLYYDPPPPTEPILSATHLQNSLAQTLDYYPQWCGQLSYTKAQKPGAGHTARYRRVNLTYNTSNDVGVVFTTATSPKILADVIPSAEERIKSDRAWDAGHVNAPELIPSIPLAMSRQAKPDSPNMTIQHTVFACGSTTIGIAMTHGLADAQSMSHFIHDWSVMSHSMLSPGDDLPKPTPVFDPELLDRYAAGNIDADCPDPSIISKSQKLPRLRGDWYKHVEGQPWPTMTPPDWHEQDLSTLSESDPIPWSDWDTTAPVSNRILHFSSAEILQIYATAQNAANGARFSKLDALLAHLWQCIARAREVPQKHICLTFGLRARLSPPLPSNFLGSPIMNALVPVPCTASQIRQSLSEYTHDNLAAILHAEAFEVSPQRLWRAMLGGANLLVTTWLNLKLYELNWGTGVGTVRWVQPDMGCDGLVEIMEAPGVGKKDGMHWSDNGVDVNLFLESKTMARVLADRELFPKVE